MSSANFIQNVALVGGTGAVGSQILQALIAAKRFNITVISRNESTAVFPSTVKVLRGDYSDAFFVQALTGQDALVMAISFTADPEIQTRLIHAAAQTGTKWILPTEFGSDNAHTQVREEIFINSAKTKYRDLVEKLGKSHWLGIVNGPWYDYSLAGGHFQIDIKNRKATLVEGGGQVFNSTTLEMVGRAVAALLALPVDAAGGEASLSSYKDSFVYISSFRVSQKDILAAVQKATHTSEKDWTIEQRGGDEFIDEGRQRVQAGDMYGMVNMLYGFQFRGGLGGDYEASRGLSNSKLGLPEDNLLAETKKVVEAVNKAD